MGSEKLIIADSTETGSLGIMHLKRFWDKIQLKKNGQLNDQHFFNEWNIDNTMLSVLGLGLEQTIRQVYTFPGDFTSFENWILQVNKEKSDLQKINEFNSYISSRLSPDKKTERTQGPLSENELAFWDEQGYIIIKNAVTQEDCREAINAICECINISRDDPSTWYNNNPNRQGIMVQLFQHPALEKNRCSLKIRSAFEQLWQRKDLWMNTDRAGFNPPETSDWHFPGPYLHFDISLAKPIPLGTAGILYLTDTATNQGAFTLVPGFHRRAESWLESLAPDKDPRNEDLYALGAIPIAANAGDFIIWHHILPHGSSVNTATLPRFVQYINYAPLDADTNPEWK
jgi:hypothetical protein